MKLLATIICLFVALPCFAANVLLSEGFEDNGFLSRSWYDGAEAYTIPVVSSGCYSGNCLQWTFNSSGTNPTQMPTGALRKLFTATDTLYVDFYIKFGSGWRGSQQAYHPHMIMMPSDADEDYCSLANNYLQTYIEFLSDVGSPYTIRPSLALQDELNVNTSNGTPPNDLRSVTENRSVNYCNTPVSSGATGACYADATYYSANIWTVSSTFVSDNTWHHIQAYFKMNTISGSTGQYDGIMQEWIDGTLIVNHSDVLYRTNQHSTLKWHQFVIAPYIGNGSPITQSFYIDSLNVYDGIPSSAAGTLAGCSASGVTFR